MKKNPLALSRPKLAARVDAASPETQRAIVLALLEHIYQQHVPIHNADEVLAAVRAGQYGDSPLRNELWQAHREAEGASLDYAEQIDDIEHTGQNAPDELRRKYRAESQLHSALPGRSQRPRHRTENSRRARHLSSPQRW